MKKILVAHACIFLYSVLPAQEITTAQYREDFDFFWNTIKKDYAYWDKKQTDWEKVKQLYEPLIDTISSKTSFILLLEKVFCELYDHHASLNTNTRESQRLVPSGTDIWAEYINGRPVITELRQGFGAEKSGLKAGMEVLAFNDIPVQKAIQPFLAKSLKQYDAEAASYALRVLLAGSHAGQRKITVRSGSGKKDYYPDQPVNLLKEHQYNGHIESKIFTGSIGYIRINDRLWDNGLIPLFDSVLASLKDTRALVLDLRETASGGNTTVARSIMGHFISKEGFYQKHELAAEEREYGVKRSWAEIVSPKTPIYSKPLVLLVNHWTGSVAEGITIGLDALKRAKIIGNQMAGLNGANYSYKLPHTGIGFSFPVEKLKHVNGKPREEFRPHIRVDSRRGIGRDPILATALEYLKGL